MLGTCETHAGPHKQWAGYDFNGIACRNWMPLLGGENVSKHTVNVTTAEVPQKNFRDLPPGTFFISREENIVYVITLCHHGKKEAMCLLSGANYAIEQFTSTYYRVCVPGDKITIEVKF